MADYDRYSEAMGRLSDAFRKAGEQANGVAAVFGSTKSVMEQLALANAAPKYNIRMRLRDAWSSTKLFFQRETFHGNVAGARIDVCDYIVGNEEEYQYLQDQGYRLPSRSHIPFVMYGAGNMALPYDIYDYCYDFVEMIWLILTDPDYCGLA